MAAANPSPSPISLNTPEPLSAGPEGPIEGTIRLATSWVGQVTGYASAMVAAAYAWQKLETPLTGVPKWLRILIVAAPLILALALQAIPAVIARRRKRWLARIPGHLQPGYFQLAPRDKEASFDRADGKHEEVLRWLEESQQTVLYLTGLSGSGKSSLLAAWVLPNLRRRNTAIVRLRGYQDPVTALEAELQRPGIIWQKPDQQKCEIFQLIERAARHVRPKRLLIVFDQFEEFVILQGSSQQERFNQLMTSLRDQARDNVTFLFVFRSDYIGLVEKLALPSLRQNTNWEDIPPFTESAARDFMRKSGLPVSDELLHDVLREAAEIEQAKGLIRPIAMNLCGLVLGRFATGLPRGFRPGQLIRGFLQESILLPPIRDFSPRIIPHLISGYVTKRPRTLTDLARDTELDTAAIRGCLRILGQSDRAIVRPLDSEQQTWEISHDFLVPLLDSILARSTVSFWRSFRTWLPWILTTLLLIAAATVSYWMKAPVVEQLYLAKIRFCHQDDACIVTAISALQKQVPAKSDTPSEPLYADQALGEIVRSSPESMALLHRVYGVNDAGFLGTGFSMPLDRLNSMGERILEYLVPNFPDTQPGVLVWKLEPGNSYAHRKLADVLNTVDVVNHRTRTELQATRSAMKDQLFENDSPAVVRFAVITPGKYSGCLGRPEAHDVFASHLGMMESIGLTVEQASSMSGHSLIPGNGDLYVFVFVPARGEKLSEPTWTYMVSNLRQEVRQASPCSLQGSSVHLR